MNYTKDKIILINLYGKRLVFSCTVTKENVKKPKKKYTKDKI